MKLNHNRTAVRLDDGEIINVTDWWSQGGGDGPLRERCDPIDAHVVTAGPTREGKYLNFAIQSTVVFQLHDKGTLS